MIDPTIIIAASLWCGVPNLPMSGPKKNEEINQCRKEFIECVMKQNVTQFNGVDVPEECLNVKLRK